MRLANPSSLRVLFLLRDTSPSVYDNLVLAPRFIFGDAAVKTGTSGYGTAAITTSFPASFNDGKHDFQPDFMYIILEMHAASDLHLPVNQS